MKGEKRKFVGHLYHGYDVTVRSRGMRQHRGPHFTFGAMDVSEPAAKRARTDGKTRNEYEAHMIPGVDGVLTFGFPKSIITQLRYVTHGPLTATAGALTTNYFSANGIFDPDVTGVGHQPIFRDQYAGLYENYVVLGSKITVTWATNGTIPLAVNIGASATAAAYTGMEYRMEQSNSVHDVLAPSGGKATLFMTYEPNADLGVNASSDGSSITSVGSNPTNQFFYTVSCTALDAAGAVASTSYLVDIEYTVKFTELFGNNGAS